MIRYFFHLHEADRSTVDREGRLMEDIASAETHAIRCARQYLSHGLAEGRLDLRGSIEVVDSETDTRCTVAFREAVEVVS